MNESKAARYQRMRRRSHVAAWLMAGLMLAVIALTPIARWAYEWSAALAAPLPPALQPAASLFLYVSLVIALCELAIVPAEFHRSRRIDAAYGQGASGTLRSRLVGTLVLLPAVVLAAVVVVAAGRLAPQLWWLLAGVVLSLGFAVAVRIGPAILGGIGGVRPLTRTALEARISELARRTGVPVAAIQEWRVEETSPTVAMVAGVGRGRRVLVATDVVRHWSDEEVTVVVAHELAHHVHRDLLQALALNTVVIGAGLFASEKLLSWAGSWIGATSAADPASLPVIALATLVVWLAATPFRHAQSRWQERRADRFALASTGHAEAFATAVRRVSARHLVDERPSLLTRWLFHRHPSVAERLALAERYLQARAGSP
jgi:STE24 endopeptidase